MAAEPAEPVRQHFWPTWGRADGYAKLAQYVSTDALVYSGVAGTPAEAGTDVPATGRDVAVGRDRFEYMQNVGFEYAYEPYVGPKSTRQQIRHPLWMRSGNVATCLDLAAAYAAMCRLGHVATLIAVDQRHAWVVLRPGGYEAVDDNDWRYDDAGDLAPPGTIAEEQGVWLVEDAEAFKAAPEFLPVDSVVVTDKTVSFDDAVARGRDRISWRTRLVDVSWLLDHGVIAPLEPPTHPRPGIRLFVPGGRGETTAYTSRGNPRDLIADAGVSVLHGLQGTGKSTVARDLALDAKHGAAWFLDASNKQALIDSLARAELAERNELVEELTDQTREGYAFAALDRLRDATDPWLVVLDNADGPPSALRGMIPEPDAPEQLVVVTTTYPGWQGVQEVTRFRTLQPLGDGEVADRLDPAFVDIVLGRPLLLEAFARLRTRVPALSAAIAALVAGRDLELPTTGPAVFWLALHRMPLSRAALELCAIAAQLPPDHQPVELLERLAGAHEGTFVELAERGLFSWDGETEQARLHRLFGASIRAELQEVAPELLDEAALRIAENAEALVLLDRRGDPETSAALSKRLTDLYDHATSPDERLGMALHHLAWVLELKGDTPGSSRLYERAERHLLGERREVVEMRCDCMHGRARVVNQKHAQDEPLVRAAIAWTREAQGLLTSIGRFERTGRVHALEGLLLQKTAAFTKDPEEKTRILEEARDILVAADALRRTTLAKDDPELARSTFNLGGINIDLAKANRDEARYYLEAAEDAYGSARAFRVDVYDRETHPHIAACDNGLALVNYYRAMLVPADVLDRTEWLRHATTHAQDALIQRQLFSGPEDLVDVQKSVRLLAKIATARWSLPARSEPTLVPLHNEVIKELRDDAGIVLPEVPRLASDADALEHIRAWTTSAALAAVVERFGGRAPAPDGPPIEELAALLAFTKERWDFRQKQATSETKLVERNQVVEPVFSGYDEMLVEAAARSLGLADPPLKPPRREYDHVVILGGLARGSIARPLAAAKLITDGVVSTPSIIGLGAIHNRFLNAQEQRLMEQIDVDGLEHELDAVDVGMRRAFGVNGPAVVSAGGEGFARWEVRSRHAGDGTALTAFAAPAPSEDGRANTVSSYRFLDAQGILHPGQSILLVTTRHYRPYQLAEAIRELGDRHTIDAYGMSPGAYDYRLAYQPTTSALLQEIRSTIRAYGELARKLTA